MPRYELLFANEDGSTTTGDYDSGPDPREVGEELDFDGGLWRVVAEQPIEHRTYIARLVLERA